LNKEILYSRHIGYCTQYNNCIDTITMKNISMKAVIETMLSGLNNPQNQRDDYKEVNATQSHNHFFIYNTGMLNSTIVLLT
jgi:hypothetical protein